MKRVLTVGAAIAALLASFGWIVSGGAIAPIPGALGALFGTIVTTLQRRPSKRDKAAGVAVAAGVVVTFIVLDDEIALFFGAVVTISIVVTELVLWLRYRLMGKQAERR